MQSKKQQEVIPLSLGITTAYLIKGSKCVLVDSGNAGSASRILKQLSSRDIEPGQISLIVLTHGHTDHTGDLLLLKEKTGAPVAAHRDEVDALRRGANLHLKAIGLSGRLIRRFTKEKVAGQEMEPDILVNKEMDLKPYGVKGKIIATPGHTPGSLSLVLPGGEVIVGDLVMGGLLRRKSPRLPFFAHDIKRLERSIKMILKLKPTTIYAAHGGPFNLESVGHKINLNKKQETKQETRSKRKEMGNRARNR